MASPRKLSLDWERGLAVVFMVEVHTLDAWIAPASRGGAVYDALTMIGGFAAPSFLFMAGLSQVLGDDAMLRRGVAEGTRSRIALRRAGWLLGVAYGFRLAEYVLGGMFRVPGGWQDILRVDILNVIALSLAAGAVLLRLLPPPLHLVVAAASTAAIAAVTPLAAAWQHPPSRVLDYLYASYPRANFSLLNWSAFLLAGAAVGRLVAARERPALLVALGGALLAGGWAADALPPVYRYQDFWHTSPSWFSMRLGAIVALTGALQLLPVAADRALRWLRTLGRHSLLGYLASIELTYGFVTRPLHRALGIETVLAGIVAMTALTWALAVAADRLRRRPPQPGGNPRGAVHAS